MSKITFTPSSLDELLSAYREKSFEKVTDAVDSLLLNGYPASLLLSLLLTTLIQYSTMKGFTTFHHIE
jgi:hypothetical protein